MTIRVYTDPTTTSDVASAKCAPFIAPATQPPVGPTCVPSGSTTNGGSPAGELCFCTYNLDIRPTETFRIRDYVRYCDSSIRTAPVVGWDSIAFTYTAGGANDPTVPADWHLADFQINAPVTVTTADSNAVGNHGQVRSKVTLTHPALMIYANRASSASTLSDPANRSLTIT